MVHPGGDLHWRVRVFRHGQYQGGRESRSIYFPLILEIPFPSIGHGLPAVCDIGQLYSSGTGLHSILKPKH